MPVDSLLPRILLLLGAGFLVANVRISIDFLRFRKLKPSAVLTWPGRRPPLYGLLLGLGIVFGALIFYKVVIQQRPPTQVFGESMMFVYYGYALPLSQRIGRGFYADGIWADAAFVPYSQIGGLSWREGQPITLMLIYRTRHLVRPLTVPDRHYAAARRLLRDKIAAHDIHFTGKGLDLGERDDRDVV